MGDILFMVSVFDLIDNPDFETLCGFLGLNIRPDWLGEEYDGIERGQGDVYLFRSHTGWVLFDLFKEPTDQNEMVLVGVRCPEEGYPRVRASVEAIYKKAPVRSARLEEGRGILSPFVSPGHYPLERATITMVGGKEAYRFSQNLRLFEVGDGELG